VSSVDAKIAKKKAKKKAEKAVRIARKRAEAELFVWCGHFSRGYRVQGKTHFDCDEVGVMCSKDSQGDIACPISVIHFLIDNKQLHSTEQDSDVKCFYESEYDLISNLPEHLDRFAAVIQHGAKLARAAKIGDVKAGDYDEDDDSDDE
jgi:hypothetical protein